MEAVAFMRQKRAKVENFPILLYTVGEASLAGNVFIKSPAKHKHAHVSFRDLVLMSGLATANFPTHRLTS